MEDPINRLHIGFVLSDLYGGGAQRVMLTLASSLMQRGHQVDLLLLRPSGDYATVPGGMRLYYLKGRRFDRKFLKNLSICRVPIISLWISPIHIVRMWLTLRRQYPHVQLRLGNARDALGVIKFVKKACPAVIYSALPRANTSVSLGRKFIASDIPTVVSVHVSISNQYTDSQLAKSRVFDTSADAIVVPSYGLRREAIQMLKVDGKKVHCIYNSVPSSDIHRLMEKDVEHQWFLDPLVPVALNVARLDPFKDQPTLIEAFSHIRSQTPARLIIMGSGTESQRIKLRSMAANLGIDQDIDFLDFDENPFRYMRRARVVVLSSIAEGLPTVLLEAMACGTPVVSTDAPHGPDEILKGGRYGKLVPVRDPPALAQAVLEVLSGDIISETELRCRAEDFSEDSTAEAHEKLFQKILVSVP